MSFIIPRGGLAVELAKFCDLDKNTNIPLVSLCWIYQY